MFTSIYCLNQIFNLSQSLIYFSNNSLILSVETKVKYLFRFFSSMYPFASPIIGYKVFYCDISNIINTNNFAWFLVYF